MDRRPPAGTAAATAASPAARAARVTAYTNTWALGRLAPGQTARFQWGVTAVKPGTYTVAYQVAAGLNGKAKAVASDGTLPSGVFHVHDRPRRPAQAYVNNAGQVVTTPVAPALARRELDGSQRLTPPSTA